MPAYRKAYNFYYLLEDLIKYSFYDALRSEAVHDTFGKYKQGQTKIEVGELIEWMDFRYKTAVWEGEEELTEEELKLIEEDLLGKD